MAYLNENKAAPKRARAKDLIAQVEKGVLPLSDRVFTACVQRVWRDVSFLLISFRINSLER